MKNYAFFTGILVLLLGVVSQVKATTEKTEVSVDPRLRPSGQWSAFTGGNANTPPMGWNSWNAFRTEVDEGKVMGAAKAIVDSGLAQKGYKYINVDDGWWLKRRQSDSTIVIRTSIFPSADMGDGKDTSFRTFVDRIHDMGLKAGIYTDVGRNACSQVWDLHSPNLPEGSTEEREVGLWNHMPEDIALFFREWGFDYVKVDACGIADYSASEDFVSDNDYQPFEPFVVRGDLPSNDVAAVEGLYYDLSKTLSQVNPDNDYILSICTWGTANVRSWGKNYGNLWRTSEDIRSSWESMLHVFDSAVTRALFAGPGNWNDPDMLYIGHGDFDENHLIEAKSHFALWSVISAPLMIGYDLRDAPRSLLDIWGAEEIIAVNQDRAGNQGVLAYDGENSQVIVKSLRNPSEKAVVLFNRSAEMTSVTLRASDLNMNVETPISLRNLWLEKDQYRFEGEKAFQLQPHESLIFKASGERQLTKGLYLSEMPGRINVAVDGVDELTLDPKAHRKLSLEHKPDRHGSSYRQHYPGFGGPRINVSPYGDSITLNGEKYRNGIGVLANSRLEVKTLSEFDSFSVVVGMDENTPGTKAKVEFVVYGDGKKIASSPALGIKDKPLALSANVQNINIIELVARQVGEESSPVVVAWANAVFE